MRGKNLTEGDIIPSLIRLAIPIMATSLINMLYNLTDMMWLGQYSKLAVAAAGTVAFFSSLAVGIISIVQTGTSVGVAQSYGRRDYSSVGEYISNGLKLNLIFAVSYCLGLFIFRNQLIDFYKIGNPLVVKQAVDYLKIISIGLLFQFFNPVFSSIFNAMGNSISPFRVNALGLVTNIILDPILIFGLGPFPELGIKGAAIATSLAQIVVFILFIYEFKKSDIGIGKLNFKEKFDRIIIKTTFIIGLPRFLEATLRTLIAMGMHKILAIWGENALAVSSIGIQIESLSWMTALGFSTALSSFAGQNYGVGNIERVREGYKAGLKIVTVIGLLATLIFAFLGEPIFSIFIPGDTEAIAMGANYLRILAYIQIFMCYEIVTMGAFNGIGKSAIPAVISVGFNLTRIPIALILSNTAMGLDGIWWSMTSTGICKGITTVPLFLKTLNKLEEKQKKSIP